MNHRHVHAVDGLTLVYHWDNNFGWSFEVTGHPKERRREAVKLSLKHWPKIPVDKLNDVVENNKKLLEICRAVVVDYE